jgi:hypothetical protein
MTIPKMPFSRVALIALAVGVLANLFQAVVAPSSLILIVANVGCLVALSAIAVQFHKEGRAGFDAVVAAETIVAFGVTSLILSLVAAVFPLISGHELEKVFQGGGLRRIAPPFLEGLATAGLAPLFAMVLRNRVSELDGAKDPIGDAADLSRAMAGLVRGLDAARKSAESVDTSLTSVGASMRLLADNVQTEGERLKLVLLEAQSQLRGLGGAAETGRTEVGGLATETAKLKGSVGDTHTLMEALAKLIESVERFVAPATRAGKRA